MRHTCIRVPSHAYYSLCHILVAPSPSSLYCLVSIHSHSYLPLTHQHPTLYMSIYNVRSRKHVHGSTHTYVDTGVSTFLSGGECNEVISLFIIYKSILLNVKHLLYMFTVYSVQYSIEFNPIRIKTISSRTVQ